MYDCDFRLIFVVRTEFTKRIRIHLPMKKRLLTYYVKLFLISSVAGYVTFLIISFFFTRAFSWELVFYSAILGPIIGNMIGFSCALIGDPISRRLESLPKPFSTISQALTYFVVSLLAATLYFFLLVKMKIMVL